MLRWLGDAINAAVNWRVMHAIPQNYFSKRLAEPPYTGIKQVKNVIESGMISLQNISHSAEKELMQTSLSNGMHSMFIVCLLFVINFFYTLTSIKE